MAEPRARRDFAAAFAAVKQRAISASLPGDTYAALCRRVAVRAGRRRRRWYLTLGLAAAAAGITTVVVLRPPVRPATVDGFALTGGSPALRWRALEGGGVEVTKGEATLAAAELGAALHARSGSRLRREAGGIRVLLGEARFEVASRPAGEMLRVFVSHGVIEVVGTRFTVRQGADSGEVQLESGRVRFVSQEGILVFMEAGETLRYPFVEARHEPEAEAPAPRPLAPGPRARPTEPRPTSPPAAAVENDTPLDPRALLRDIRAMRVRREYALLEASLEQALAGELSGPLRERISFELCDLLAVHGKDRAEACDRIAEHLRRYGGGEYVVSLQRHWSALGCAR